MSRGADLKAKLVDWLPAPIVFRVAPVLYRRQEPELGLVRHFVPADRTAIDIGGWLGPWTRELARRCPSVHTFEPQPDLAAFLRKVVPANVTVHEAAVSDQQGVLPLVIPSAGTGQKALASLDREADEGAVVHQVRVVRLDDESFDDVGFIKIDVEGREREVIDGALTLVRRDRPVILLEAEQRHLDSPLADLFEHVIALGYDGWFLREGAWHPLAEFDVDADQLAHVDDVIGPAYINNFLFLPDGQAPPTTG
ncbi:MAG: FkbM family methyltransferase [Acidimicrobiales bacterium]